MLPPTRWHQIPCVIENPGRLRRALHVLRYNSRARRESRSRVAELIEEAKELATHHAEIVLTGVHIGTYGETCGAWRAA